MRHPYKAWFFCQALAVLALHSISAEAQGAEESISGRHFRAVQTAIFELERNKLNVTDYRIIVWETETSVVILFGDPNAPQGQRGSSGKSPAFSVELAKDDLRIVRTQFDR